MNRRDLIFIFLIIVWGIFIVFVIPTLCKTAMELIMMFDLTLFAVLLLFIVVLILSLCIKRFGCWGDKKVFGKD